MATPRGRTTWPGTSFWLAAFFVAASLFSLRCECRCGGCDLAYASYYITQNQTLAYISSLFGIGSQEIESRILPPNNLTSKDSIQAGSRVKIPFSCGCLDDGTLGQTFSYLVQPGDNYATIATEVYKNLTTETALRRANSYEETRVPDNVNINVTVNCFCGDADVSRDYGLFSTYPLISGETLASVANANGFNSSLLRSYNPTVNSSVGEIIYVPTRDENGSYRPLNPRKGLSGGAIAGISVAAVVSLVLIICLSVGIYRIKKTKREMLLPFVAGDNSLTHKEGAISASDGISVQTPAGASSTLTGITMDKSVEFSYEELASATNDFNMSNKIGEGGFGAVYYAELRGEKAAIKKMDMQATKEFLAELNVLTHVHHLNLVHLIGYCIEGSLFLVYEYIENGNLNQHLRGSSGKEPLPWSVRVQIALDAARGLEYIHEHTVPVYIHRDIKSANILIDKNFRAKVADFGLTKLTEVGGASLQTRLVGTFGYMPPEYAQYGEVSPKIDVYAFGVVLFELISAKGAIVKTNESETESRGLVGLFENVLSQPDPREDLAKLIDPRLGDNYPIDSVYKMAQLAKACTQENPQLRPSMRSIVVALMTLSSSTEDWDVHAFYGNQALVNLMSGR